MPTTPPPAPRSPSRRRVAAIALASLGLTAAGAFAYHASRRPADLTTPAPAPSTAATGPRNSTLDALVAPSAAPPSPNDAATRAAAAAACEQGKADACATLADLEYAGTGGPKDDAAAVRHAAVACEQKPAHCWNAAEYAELTAWSACTDAIHRAARDRADRPACLDDLAALTNTLAPIRAQYERACTAGRGHKPVCDYLAAIDAGHERTPLIRLCNFHRAPNLEGACQRLAYLDTLLRRP